MSGPIHGSGVRPALCQPTDHRSTPARAGHRRGRLGQLVGVGVAHVEDPGREAVGGEHDLDGLDGQPADLRRPRSGPAGRGTPAPGARTSTMVKSTPASAAAASARLAYSPTDSAE